MSTPLTFDDNVMTTLRGELEKYQPEPCAEKSIAVPLWSGRQGRFWTAYAKPEKDEQGNWRWVIYF